MPHIINYGGRFKLWDRPAVYPQVDLVDGTPEGPVFDLDVHNEDGGVLYLKASHVEEMARQLGWISPENAEDLREEIRFMENRIQNLPNAIEELKDGIDSRIREFYNSLDGKPAPSVEGNESTAEIPGESDGAIKDSDYDDLESLGLAVSEGPNGISSNSSDGKSPAGKRSNSK